MINQTIAEWMGKCWHEFLFSGNVAKCSKCTFQTDMSEHDFYMGEPSNPEYDSESSPRELLAEVEKRVIEVFSSNAYVQSLAEVMETRARYGYIGKFMTASAVQRCAAIVRLIEE